MKTKMKKKVIRMNENMLEALVQNYNFKMEKKGKLPTIDFVYPNFTADGNTEEFRFSYSLEQQLRDRAHLVREGLEGRRVAYTLDETTLLEVGKVAPRLGLEEQISGKINSIYSYAPLLFIGVSQNDFKAYVVKPLVDASMAWFELTEEETAKVKNLLEKKAEEKPYKTLIQRIFG
jgi:hypothetical protein